MFIFRGVWSSSPELSSVMQDTAAVTRTSLSFLVCINLSHHFIISSTQSLDYINLHVSLRTPSRATPPILYGRPSGFPTYPPPIFFYLYFFNARLILPSFPPSLPPSVHPSLRGEIPEVHLFVCKQSHHVLALASVLGGGCGEGHDAPDRGTPNTPDPG